MDTWVILLAQLVPLCLLAYLYIQRRFNYWFQKGVTGPAPSILQIGNFVPAATQDPIDYERRMTSKHGKIYGSFNCLQPMLNIADAELVKQICVKDFNHFINYQKLNTNHEVASKIIFLTDDTELWRRLRTITSPCFSSGKLKQMQLAMDQSVDNLVSYFSKLDQDRVLKDVRQSMVGFTLDVLASNIFGVKTDSNQDNYSGRSENQFLKNGIGLFQISFLQILAFFVFPKWLNGALGQDQVFSKGPFQFFENFGHEIIRKRKQAIGPNGQRLKRNDLIDLLIDAEETEGAVKGKLTETEIIAQAIGFIIGGFDTAAGTLTHALFELAQNPEVQEKLHDQLDQAVHDLPDQSEEHYEAVLNRIPYLEAVIKETLRKYPPFAQTQRILADNSKDYKMAGVKLDPGQQIQISVVGMHYTAEYFPEPDQFQPERFLPENKDKLVPYSFLPFGAGPRNCLGLRFAMQEMKLCLAKLVRQFRFEPTESTPKKMSFNPFGLLSVKPFELKVIERQIV